MLPEYVAVTADTTCQGGKGDLVQCLLYPMTPRRAPLHHVTGTNYHSLDLPRNPGCVIHKCMKGLKDEKTANAGGGGEGGNPGIIKDFLRDPGLIILQHIKP